jgi:DNA polymerase I
MRLFLVSATYNNKKFCVDLIFYNPETEKLITISDTSGHKPYCLTREEFKTTLEEITATERKYTVSTEERYDSIADMDVNMFKIQAPDPLSIGGSSESIRNRLITWESDIRYYDRYLYDQELICGLWYNVDNGLITPFEDNSIDFTEVESRLQFGKNKQYDEFVKNWVQILNQSIPDIKRLSVDIEVEYDGDKIPTVNIPTKKITAIGFCSNDGFKRVNVLNPKGDLPDTQTTFYYTSEYKMLVESMDLLATYPFIITFNGDAFDLPYLYARCSKLNIHYTKIPLTLKSTRIADGAYVDPVYIKNAIHIDLYRFFKNPSIQNYAFSHKYSEFGLDAIAKGLINEAKITHQGSLNTLTPDKLAEYCLNDAEITMKLTTFNDNLFMKLVTMICRISKMPYDDCTRYGANQWGKGMIFSEMVKRNILIPRLDELLIKGTTASKDATIKDKKYAGAFVFTPTKGVYFDVKNVDFGSLYPSIIKENNISFETINCPHQSCMKNTIPETTSWKCERNFGLISQIIGSLRDLRINYYKFMSKKQGLTEDQHQFYDIISQTLKVIMNASYGILGFEAFPLYCLPVAESVTAYGRYIILQTMDKAKELGLKVVYGDTDSMYIHKAGNDSLKKIMDWTKNTFGIDLELDKSYRYLVLTELKKNYLGITDKGKADIKGLTGKKSHTPVFIRELFFQILDILCNIQKEEEVPKARETMSEIIRKRVNDLKENAIPFNKLAYNIVINKNINSYGRKISTHNINVYGKKETIHEFEALPQHIKAAKMLPNAEAGSVISLIKIKDGVKPVQLVKSIDEVDKDKYIDLMANTFGQILDSFKLDFNTIISNSKQMTMDDIANLVVLKDEKK